MLITITQYADLAQGPNGGAVPLGGHVRNVEALTADGAAAAIESGVTLVRIATDTKVQVDVGAGAAEELMHANSTEFFAVTDGQVLTFATVA